MCLLIQDICGGEKFRNKRDSFRKRNSSKMLQVYMDGARKREDQQITQVKELKKLKENCDTKKVLTWSCLLCILTSFQVLHTTQSWSEYFFGRFQPFLFISYVFSDFSTQNKKNNIWKQCFGYYLKMVDTLMLVDSLRGYPILSFVWFIFSCLGIFLRHLACIWFWLNWDPKSL